MSSPTSPDEHVATYQASAPGQSDHEPSRVPARFVLIRLADLSDGARCKLRVRETFAEQAGGFHPFKASVHIGDTHEQHVQLANMAFNNNSIRLMNYAHGLEECGRISSLLARSLHKASVPTPPSVKGMVNLPDSIIVDSGAALAVWGLRNRTDIDVVGLWKEFGATAVQLAAQVHHFAQQPGGGRPWGREHLQTDVNAPSTTAPSVRPLDFLFDPKHFGWCHGVKVMGLEQLALYKARRGEKGKDRRDIELINSQLSIISGTARYGERVDSCAPTSC